MGLYSESQKSPSIFFMRTLFFADVNANSGPVRFTKDSIMTFKNNTNFTVNAPPASFTTEMTIRTRQTDAVLIHEQIAGRNAYLKVRNILLSIFCKSLFFQSAQFSESGTVQNFGPYQTVESKSIGSQARKRRYAMK